MISDHGSILKSPFNDSNNRKLWLDEDAYATGLLLLAVDRLGFDHEKKQPNVFLWAPATIRMEIEHEFNITLPKTSFDKLMAAVTIVTTDLFFKNPGAFNTLVGVLTGNDFQPDEYEQSDSAEIAWAITESLLLSPPDNSDPEPFSTEVRHYIGHVLRRDGFIEPPDVLRIALGRHKSADVMFHHGDDKELYEQIRAVQQTKNKEITDLISDGLSDLLGQVKSLSLEHGDTTDLEQKLGLTLQTLNKGDKS
jgi:hypothetical protein